MPFHFQAERRLKGFFESHKSLDTGPPKSELMFSKPNRFQKKASWRWQSLLSQREEGKLEGQREMAQPLLPQGRAIEAEGPSRIHPWGSGEHRGRQACSQGRPAPWAEKVEWMRHGTRAVKGMGRSQELPKAQDGGEGTVRDKHERGQRESSCSSSQTDPRDLKRPPP